MPIIPDGYFVPKDKWLNSWMRVKNAKDGSFIPMEKRWYVRDLDDVGFIPEDIQLFKDEDGEIFVIRNDFDLSDRILVRKK